MDRTVLNADVLLFVFSLAHKQTKLALMSSCQVLYREAGKQLLKDMDRVWLTRQSCLESFLLFMDADGGSRMRHLHQLILELVPLSRPVAKRLKGMLNRLASVSRLTDLTIGGLEPLLSAHPFLSTAIAELTSIKSIRLYGAEKNSVEMLKSMQSELETVDFAFADPASTEKNKRGDRDFIMFLRPFSSSLRYLSVDGCGTSGDHRDAGIQYLLLSHLTLDEPASPVTWHYVHAFPNLQYLSIATREHGTDEAEEVGINQFRADNEAQLRRHGCWKSLNRFDGDIVMLWLLGLSCPVENMQLCGDYYFTPDILRDALAPTRPKQLDIAFYRFGPFLDEEFTQAFTEGCGATVKVLTLMLDINRDEDEMQGHDWYLGDVLDAITDMLRSFSTLESVTLMLGFLRLDWLSDEEGMTPAEVFAEDMDVDAMCTALHEAVPSASYLRFELQEHKTRGTVTAEIGSEEKK